MTDTREVRSTSPRFLPYRIKATGEKGVFDSVANMNGGRNYINPSGNSWENC